MPSDAMPPRRAGALKLTLFMLIALVAAGFAWRSAAGQYYLSVAPGAAPYVVASANSAIPVKLADISMQSEQGGEPDKAKVRGVALAALNDAPLNSAAVRLLSGLVQLKPGMPLDIKILSLSEDVTRRDAVTEISLADAEARRRNAKAAMLHIDRLLTVKPRLIPDILPQLLAFARQDDLRAILMSKQDRPWYPGFISQAIEADPEPQYVARLVRNMDDDNPGLEKINLDRLAGKLALAGQYDDAIAFAGERGESTKALAAFTPNEDNTLPDLAPLTWRFANQAEGSAMLSAQGWVDVDIASGKPVALMERVVKITPGRHVLTTKFEDAGNIDGLWRWQMLCNSGGKWTPKWSSNWTAFSEGDSELPLNVPAASCSEQQLTLTATVDGRGNDIFSVKVSLQ